jgi:FkbM family methyltransferase
MRLVSRLLPKQVRNRLRYCFDSLYSKSLPDKETIGVLSQWTIVTRGMGPHTVMYSGGVGEDITFEQELIRRFGLKIHIYDPSPVAKRTIALANDDRLIFSPVGLAASDRGTFSVGGGTAEATWFKAGGTGSLPCTSIPREMALNSHSFIDLLKIDIEGFEYEVLESCFAERIPIKQICVEFHDFFPDVTKAQTKNMIRTIESHGYDLIHRHRHDHTFLKRDPSLGKYV